MFKYSKAMSLLGQQGKAGGKMALPSECSALLTEGLLTRACQLITVLQMWMGTVPGTTVISAL